MHRIWIEISCIIFIDLAVTNEVKYSKQAKLIFVTLVNAPLCLLIAICLKAAVISKLENYNVFVSRCFTSVIKNKFVPCQAKKAF